MAHWKQIIAKITNDVESHFDHLKQKLSERFGRDGMVQIIPYMGYGTQNEVYIRGRVLRNHDVQPAAENDTIWQNLLNTYRRFETDEVPHAQIIVQIGAQLQTIVADEEGYFNEKIELERSLSPDQHFMPFLLRYKAESGEIVHADGGIIISPTTAKFGIISDIDDTVIRTDVTHWIKLARNTFLGNSHTRLPFPGVAALYQELHRGTWNNQNPLFYVSNSPWNLHDLLSDFFEVRRIPQGVFFLRDFGLTADYFLADPDHKIKTILHLLNVYPDMKFILIGDSGELDAEIYYNIVQKYPNRILATYIRDVDPDIKQSKRDSKVQQFAERLADIDAEMLLIPDSLMVAQHAADHGWIAADALSDIRREIAQTTDDNVIAQLISQEVENQ